MKVLFTPPARSELSDAVIFYEMQHPGLGARFKREVRASIQRLVEFPESASPAGSDIRKTFIRAFPYKVIYSLEGDFILILAIAHQHRLPEYWIHRN